MTSEVNAKVRTSVMDSIATSAKRQNLRAIHDFSTEISKKTAEPEKPNGKPSVLKQEKDAKVLTNAQEVPKPQLQDEPLKEQPEQFENQQVVSSMQVQQIAMNIVTVENKEDIPKIVLQEESQEMISDAQDAMQMAGIEPKAEKTGKFETLNKSAEKPENLQTDSEESITEKPVKTDVKKEPELPEKTFESTIKKADAKVSTLQSQEPKDEFEVVQTHVDSKLDASKVNIKVADAPIRATVPDMPQQIVDKITYNVEQGKHVFDIELFPEDLGKIGIKMVFEKGIAQLVMTTHTDKAHKLLSQHLEAIRGILEVNTQNEAKVEVKAGENASENFDKDNFQGQSEKNQQERQKDRKEEETDSFAQKLRLGLAE